MITTGIIAKIRVLVIGITFGMPCVLSGQTITLVVGDTASDVRVQLQKLKAIDITPTMEIVGPKGEWPLKGIYWELDPYKAIVELSVKSEKVIALCYWKEKDFSESKSHRASTRLYVQSITFDPTSKTVSVPLIAALPSTRNLVCCSSLVKARHSPNCQSFMQRSVIEVIALQA